MAAHQGNGAGNNRSSAEHAPVWPAKRQDGAMGKKGGGGAED